MIEKILPNGFRRLVLYNCHGENSNFAHEAWLAAADRTDVKIVVMKFAFEFTPQTMELLYGGARTNSSPSRRS